jgi:hypothetical protein
LRIKPNRYQNKQNLQKFNVLIIMKSCVISFQKEEYFSTAIIKEGFLLAEPIQLVQPKEELVVLVIFLTRDNHGSVANGGNGGIALNGGIANGASGSTSSNGNAGNGGIAIGVGSVVDGTSGTGNGNGQGGGVAINGGHTHLGCTDAIGKMCFNPP